MQYSIISFDNILSMPFFILSIVFSLLAIFLLVFKRKTLTFKIKSLLFTLLAFESIYLILILFLTFAIPDASQHAPR